VPPLRNGLYYVAGFAFAVTPGKLGEVVRLWLLRRHHGAPYERTAGVLLLDRVTDALPLVALCLPGAAGFAAGQAWGVAGLAAFLFAVLALAARPGALAALIKIRLRNGAAQAAPVRGSPAVPALAPGAHPA
jgi:hypothetical protein